MSAALVLTTTGCGTFMARRMAQAPNSYPTWFAPKARVELGFSPKFLSHFPARFVEVGPPAAKLRYRTVEPADYDLKTASTNWVEFGREQFKFSFRAVVPGRPIVWTGAPRGTVVLLHGYGLAQFSMAPWALRLAQAGWRCVLVDLRGHGKSTGRRIYFGTRETRDLSQLLDQLALEGQLSGPVAAMGESYGGALALRWQTVDSRVGRVVAIAPYAHLSNAVLNISREYAGWMPEAFIKAGLKKLPSVLRVPRAELDTTTLMARQPVVALLVAGAADHIAPVDEVRKLRDLAASGSKLIVVPGATHEAVTYFFDELVAPVLAWLEAEPASRTKAVRQ